MLKNYTLVNTEGLGALYIDDYGKVNLADITEPMAAQLFSCGSRYVEKVAIEVVPAKKPKPDA